MQVEQINRHFSIFRTPIIKSPAQPDFKSVIDFIHSFNKAKYMKKQYWDDKIMYSFTWQNHRLFRVTNWPKRSDDSQRSKT